VKKHPVLFLLSALILLCFAASCRQSAYPQPQISTPAAYRGADQPYIPKNTGQSAAYGQVYWGQIVIDPVLKGYLNQATANNYNIRIAAETIFQAQAQLGVVRANQYPNVTAGASYNAGKLSANGTTPIPAGTNPTYHYSAANLMAGWELDFWGKYRRATDAAKAQLLATVEGYNLVRLTMLTEVASAYFTLRELDKEVEICKETVASRQTSYNLVKSREEGGVSNMLEVDQANGLLLGAQAVLTATEQQVEQQENYLCFLLGISPQDLKRGMDIDQQLVGINLPPGLPSTLLENRPDIRQAEAQLIAANAQIDVARAAFFPKIVLTGSGGTLSTPLSQLFTGVNNTWSFVPQLTQPIFNAGQIASQVRVTQSQQRQAVINYESTVQEAFREVSDSLIGYSKGRDFRLQEQQLTDTLYDQDRLSKMRYAGGVTSYLEVLDSERQYFDAELNLARAKLNEITYMVKLYKALGGGWQEGPDDLTPVKAGDPALPLNPSLVPAPGETPAASVIPTPEIAPSAAPTPSASPTAKPAPKETPKPAPKPSPKTEAASKEKITTIQKPAK